MSSAFYPLGMKSYNNHVPQGGYKTWKGSGVFSNPVGITASHVRPLTNKDPGNIFKTGFGLPRPIKHYRKGRVIPQHYTVTEQINTVENSLIAYNMNRIVKSSHGASLGGGGGGNGLLNQLMDNPGGYVVKQNVPDEINNTEKLSLDCQTCEGVGMVVNYYPNNTYLTNNPDMKTTTYPLCCNEEKKARKRVLPASTLLKKNYYTTLQQYRENRCQTYNQRIFNFQTIPQALNDQTYPDLNVKPGSPLSLLNTYVANCYPNSEIYQATEINLVERLIAILKISTLTPAEINDFYQHYTIQLESLFNFLNTLKEMKKQALNIFVEFINNPYYGVPLEGPSNPRGCKLVVYKPNNYQYAQQGAVSSSTRTLKLDVTTIETNAYSLNKMPSVANFPFVLKQKVPKCNSPYIGPFQNKKSCTVNLPHNNFRLQSVFPTNHFEQSPEDPLL